MSQLSDHIELISELVTGRVPPMALDRLLDNGELAGPRGLVYRNSSMLASCDALKSNFQATQQIMGADFFGGAARAFVEAHRPTTRSLVGFGTRFPRFLEQTAAQHGLAWLPDLARLDLGWLYSHLAEDCEAISTVAFSELAMDPDRLFASEIKITPSTKIVRTDWDVFELWQGLRNGKTPSERVELSAAQKTILFSRPHGEVTSHEISPVDALFFASLQTTPTLGTAAERVLDAYPDVDIGGVLTKFIQFELLAKRDERTG